MRHQYCNSEEHAVSRRAMLGGLGVAGLGALTAPAFARRVSSINKRVILLWLAGGASQFETFDPKPGAKTGGPFASIPTSIPGVHVSELMPKMAQRLDDTCIIRSMDTGDAGHGGGAQLMMRGRKDEPTLQYPDIGGIIARELGHPDSHVPGYVEMYPQTEGRNSSQVSSGFLGAAYNPITLYDEMTPPNLDRDESITAEDHHSRAELRAMISKRFALGRNTPVVESHATAFGRVDGLMDSASLFDIEQEPAYIRNAYGPTQFGRQALLARRLVEAGVPFVRVSRAWWDSHGQNFETHLELVPELDHVMSTLLEDLRQRGLLDDTLVITMGEFGRTPRINASLGRDHFAKAWSCTLSGCGIVGGSVYGVSTDDGEEVKDNPVSAGDFAATIFEALGIYHNKHYHVGARPIPLVNPGEKPIREVLA